MHTFQRHKRRPRETHSTTRLHRAPRPGNTVLLIDLYIMPPSFILSLLLPYPISASLTGLFHQVRSPTPSIAVPSLAGRGSFAIGPLNDCVNT
jgi:hypothetical protein